MSHYESPLLGLSSVACLAVSEVLVNIGANVSRFNKTVYTERFRLFAASTVSSE
jgi:hypothetical protein